MARSFFVPLLLACSTPGLCFAQLSQAQLSQQEQSLARSKMLRINAETRGALAARISQLESEGYIVRDLTAEEVKILQDDWNREHPFMPSANMPDFTQYGIRVRKEDHLRQQLKETESRVKVLEAKLETVASNGAMPPKQVNATPAQPKEKVPPPPPPSTKSVIVRKLADGRVAVMTGDDVRYFKSAAEAEAHINARE